MYVSPVSYTQANEITSISTTNDRRWFASTDKGEDSMISIWESICSKPENLGITSDPEGLLNAYPIKNIYNPHDGYGVVASSFTPDNKYLITLGNGTALFTLTRPTINRA
jgi:hypothetical protein